MSTRRGNATIHKYNHTKMATQIKSTIYVSSSNIQLSQDRVTSWIVVSTYQAHVL